MRNQRSEKIRQKLGGFSEDILGAGFHILSGAGGDVKLLVQQAVQRIVGDAYVSRAEYDGVLVRLAALEGKKASKVSKTSTKTAASKKHAKTPAQRKPPVSVRASKR